MERCFVNKYNRIFKYIKLILVLLAIPLFCLSIIMYTTYFGDQRYYLDQLREERVNNRNPDYKTIETEHFTIKYLPKAEKEAFRVKYYTESMYAPITNVFKMEPPRKTMIVLKTYDQKPGQFMPGYHQNGVIYINDEPIEEVPLFVTIPHEFSHAMLRYKYAGGYRIPSWLDEGMAVNIETSITDMSKDNNNIVYSLDDLAIGLKNTPKATYAQCSAIVAYIVETHGREALFQLLSQLANEHKPLDAALQDTLYIDAAALEKNSQQYFRDNKEIHGVLRAQF